MGDYKNSPDYRGYNPTLREVAAIVLVIVLVIVAITGAAWALRRLLPALGLI
jgi:hypothetical protein